MTARDQPERTLHLTGYTVKGYKAFAGEATVMLGPLTVILGRNNAGKTALCNAPLFFTHAFEPGAVTPFPVDLRGIDFCSSLLGACFAEQPSGLSATLHLGGGEITEVRLGGVLVSEKNRRQVITEIVVEHPTKPLRKNGVLEWRSVQKLLGAYPELAGLGGTIGVLIGQRPAIERSYKLLGGPPEGIGSVGEDAVHHVTQKHEVENYVPGSILELKVFANKKPSGRRAKKPRPGSSHARLIEWTRLSEREKDLDDLKKRFGAEFMEAALLDLRDASKYNDDDFKNRTKDYTSNGEGEDEMRGLLSSIEAFL